MNDDAKVFEIKKKKKKKGRGRPVGTSHVPAHKRRDRLVKLRVTPTVEDFLEETAKFLESTHHVKITKSWVLNRMLESGYPIFVKRFLEDAEIPILDQSEFKILRPGEKIAVSRP